MSVHSKAPSSNDTAPTRTALRAPAVQALAIQCASLITVTLLIYCASILASFKITLVAAALLQGIIAAGISRWRGLASWWLYIQFAFPLALVAALSLQLPPTIFLVTFLIFLVLYWSTFRTQVPYYPSGRDLWKTVADLLPSDRPIRFIDIGSGLGGVVLSLAQRRPDSHFIGIELAPLPWLISVLRGRLTHSSVQFIRGDYDRLDFEQFDVVFAYLSPAAMPALWNKARAEMRTGTLLLSYEFPIHDIEPDSVLQPNPAGPKLYCWRM